MKRFEIVLIAILLIVSGIAHGWNMFSFPYYENDEGTYISQAWAVVEQGELAPYTYWYDHSPVGWLQIALWSVFTGGFFTFGFSVNTGRVFMLVLHVLSSLFVYLTMRRLGAGTTASAIAVLIFSLSPLAIYFQRRVLLDNIMIFWTMLSLFLLVRYDGRMRYLVTSALALAIGILSKETALLFVPAWILGLAMRVQPEHRRFAMALPILLLVSVLSLYPLYAVLQGEFFPPEEGGPAHVSLVETAMFQAGRAGGSPLDPSSDFRRNLLTWYEMDPVLIIAGVIAAFVVFIAAIRDPAARIIGAYTAMMFFYFLRGGLVIEFYIIDIVPFLAMSIGYAAMLASRALASVRFISFTRPIPYLVVGVLLALMVFVHSDDLGLNLNIYTSDQTSVQIQAVEYMIERSPSTDLYLIDGYAYVDLHRNDSYPEGVWYWKVDRDPQIRSEIIKNSSETVDYIAETPQMVQDRNRAGLDIVVEAFDDARPIGGFFENYWGVNFWATDYPRRILRDTHRSYDSHFVENGRTVHDLDEPGVTYARDQALYMLQSVWMNDSESFERAWSYTRSNMILSSGVISSGMNGSRLEATSDSVANEDAALALILAARRFEEPRYLEDARDLLAGIWEAEVETVGGTNVLLVGNWGRYEEAIAVYPGAYAPAHYRLFAEIDPDRDWLSLVDSGARIVRTCSDELPRRICLLDSSLEPTEDPSAPAGIYYADSATELPMRLYLDVAWFDSASSRQLLSSHSALDDGLQGELANAYTVEGEALEDYRSARMYGASMGYYKALYPDEVEAVYERGVKDEFYETLEVSYWQDQTDGATQLWAWIGTAVYANRTVLPDENTSIATSPEAFS